MNDIQRHPLRAGLVLLFSAASIGCQSEELGTGDAAIVGAVEASSSKLDAIGTLGKSIDGRYRFSCTATLIGPDLVLTAKHCTPREASWLYFAVGHDAKAPERIVQARAVIESPLDDGGFVGLGSDVALVFLSEAIEDIVPLRVAPGHVEEADVDHAFTAVGYGIQDNDSRMGTRRAGSLTLRAAHGQPMQAVFGTPDAFFGYLTQIEGEEYVATSRGGLEAFYDRVLLDGYEAHLGGGENDAQPCSGDSGGPLLKRDESGESVVWGVVSGSLKGRKNRCSVLGEVYATFGPEVEDMLARANGLCRDVSVRGRCEGSVTVRCVPPREGPERVTRFDCAELGQACIVDGSGTAVCDDAPEDDGG